MAKWDFKLETGIVDTPPTGYVRFYPKSDKILYYKDDTGAETQVAPITNEQIQDVIGALLTDSSTIDVTYNDAGNVLSLTVIQTALDHTQFLNIGTNTHAQIDTHLANTSNPHATTAAQVGADATGTAAAAIAAHVAAADPHTQYLTAAEGNAAYQPLDSDLTAVAGLASAGLVTRTGAGTASVRSITAGTGISVSNGDGVSGNPTITNSDTGSVAVAAHALLGGSSHPAVTTSVNGYMSAADKVKLDGIDAGANNTVITSTPPPLQNLTDAASAGVSTQVARADHTHAFNVTGVIPGTYGDINNIPQITVNSQGQVTSVVDIPAVGSEWIELVTTADIIVNSSVTLTNVTALGFTATAGNKYYLEYTVIFRAAATTTGIALTIGTSNGAAGTLACVVNIPVAADGTAALYTGNITALSDVVVGTGVQTAQPTWFIANIKGVFICTTGGIILPQFRSEVNGSNVNFGTGSVALIREFV